MRWSSYLALCLIGCGSGASSSSIPLSATGREYGAAYCDRVFACCSATDIARRFAGDTPMVTDHATCATVVGRGFGDQFMGDVSRAQLLGRAVYKPDAMAVS